MKTKVTSPKTAKVATKKAEVIAAPVAKTKRKAPAAAVVAAPPAPTPEAKVDRRITPGARIDLWRVKTSQRREFPGVWVQGGHYQQDGTRNRFLVAEQQLFSTLAEAKTARGEAAR